MMHRSQNFAALALILAICLSACPPPEGATNGGDPVDCPDGTKRIAVNCASMAGLRSRVMEANAGIPGIGFGLGGSYEEKAISQVTEATANKAIDLDNMCRQYNACAIDAETWLASERQLREHVRLVEQLKANPQASAGDAVWTNARPDLATKRLEAYIQVQARTPGGAFRVHGDGEPLRSGDKVRFALRTSTPSYVYIMLLSSQGIPTQMFPMDGIQVTNPIPANTPVLIPNPAAGEFELDNVTGKEHIQIVISDKPLADIEQRLAALGDKPTKTQGQELLQSLGDLMCPDGAQKTRGMSLKPSSVSCGGVATRGLILKAANAAAPVVYNAASSALTDVLRAVPNDTVVVWQHAIDHRAAAQQPAPAKTRGFVVGEDGFIVSQDGNSGPSMP